MSCDPTVARTVGRRRRRPQGLAVTLAIALTELGFSAPAAPVPATAAARTPIDRKALVSRHDPVPRALDVEAPLSVGHGVFAFTADVTGLQTFAERGPRRRAGRFEAAGRGARGIRAIDLKTGALQAVIDIPFRLGHLQTNPWVPGEIMYCHETTGDAPQRMWIVRADGTGNRPLYPETPDEWVTHETFATEDEVMFNLMGHLPYQRERPTGTAVVNLRTHHMTVLDQIDEDMGGGRTGGLWHGNASPDGRWAVGDSFKGNVYLIDRRNGERTLLTTDHKMRPDHAHPIFSPDGQRILIQSGRLSDGQSLDLMVVEVPVRGK